jgi:hypothetical protein
MADTKVHSKLGASSAKRWLACPGSVALCAGIPSKDSKYSREGSCAHAIAEDCLRRGQHAATWAGKTHPEFPDIKLTHELLRHVQTYCTHVRMLNGADCETRIESGFWLADIDADLFGTNDAIVFQRRTGALHVLDYKHGAGVKVFAERNPQLMYYGLGALLEFGSAVKSVTLHVVQPRCGNGAPESWTCTPAELLEFAKVLEAGAAATRQPNAPLVAGSHCQFCPASATCPQLYAEAQRTASAEFADTGEAPNPIAMSAEELGRRLAQAEILKTWIAAVERFAMAEAMAGRLPLGRKLVATSPRRAWADGTLAMRQALRHFDGLSESAVFETKPISPAQFEKLIGKKLAGEFMQPFLAEPKQGFALVAASDKRAAVTPPADAEFENLEESDNG